jgi:plasmid stabilization system protein ParE
MAIIPQYRAQGPAGPKAPAMESGQSGPRADASQALRGIARLTGAVQDGIQAGQVAGVDPNLGQRSAQGLQEIGKGVNDIGGALLDIEQRVAEAKNYADEIDFQIDMDREVVKFEEFRSKNPDPSGWKDQWDNQMSQFGGSYFEGKNLAPVAIEKINQRLKSFSNQYSNRVAIDAMKTTVGRATDSLMLEIIKAKESGNLDLVKDRTAFGVQQGWLPVDRAELINLQAQDEIEAKQVEILQNQKKTALLYNNQPLAMEAIDAMPIREDEKELERASITEQFGYNALLKTGEDILEPKDLLKWIDSDEASKLRPSDKAKFRDGAYQTLNAINSATLSGLKEEIDLRGGITPAELEGRDDFKSLSDRDKEAVRQFVTKGVQNDIAEFATLQRAMRGYEPNDDPRGSTKADLERSIVLRFDGDRAKELLRDLEEATNRTGPVSATDRVVSDIFTSLQKRYDAGEVGNFRVTGNMIREHTDENGVVSYQVDDDKGDVPAVVDRNWFDTPRRRRIELTEEDVLRFKSGKTNAGDVYEDQRAKQSAFGKFLNVQDEVSRKVKAGEFVEPDAIIEEVNRLLGGEIEGAFEMQQQSDNAGREMPSSSFGTVSNGLFDPVAASEFIKNFKID